MRSNQSPVTNPPLSAAAHALLYGFSPDQPQHSASAATMAGRSAALLDFVRLSGGSAGGGGGPGGGGGGGGLGGLSFARSSGSLPRPRSATAGGGGSDGGDRSGEGEDGGRGIVRRRSVGRDLQSPEGPESWGTLPKKVHARQSTCSIHMCSTWNGATGGKLESTASITTTLACPYVQ